MSRRLPMLRLLVAASLWLAATQVVLAHGGGTPRLTNAPVGPYRLYVWSEPEPWRAGEVHLSLAVTLPVTDTTGAAGSQVEAPVTDADIRVTLTPREPPGRPIVIQAVRQDLPGYPYFDADTVLPAAGRWDIAVQVAGAEGRGAASFELSALPAQSLNWWLVGGAGGILIILIALMGLWSRAHAPTPTTPRRAKRRVAPQAPGESTH